MNIIRHRLCLVLVALLLLAVRAPQARAATPAVPAEAPQGAPKSVFNSQPAFGKDPFFPASKRRDHVRAVVRGPEITVAKPGVPDWVILKGITVQKDRRLGIINNYTVAEGEEFSLKVNGQPKKFKCVKIKESSVEVECDGVTKELQLRPGL